MTRRLHLVDPDDDEARKQDARELLKKYPLAIAKIVLSDTRVGGPYILPGYLPVVNVRIHGCMLLRVFLADEQHGRDVVGGPRKCYRGEHA